MENISFGGLEMFTRDLERRLKFCKSENRTSDFDLFKKKLKENKNIKNAAALIPIVFREKNTSVILTKRSSQLKYHPSQIAFPGGKVEANDRSLVDTALRETYEEIGLKSEKIKIVGSLPKHETTTGFVIHPFVGVVDKALDLKINLSEVEEIFEVPLDFIIDPKNIVIRQNMINGKLRRYYVIEYGTFNIWGATARIIKTFSDSIKL